MSANLESLLPSSKRAQACAADAQQAEALRLHTAQFGHLGDRTPTLRAAAISSAASESADRLTMTAARVYAHHTSGPELLMALERDAQRMAARCASARYAPMAEVVAGFMTALLRGQVLRLMGELAGLRAEPDLLAALQAMVEQECGDKPHTDAERAAVAAIAKATGVRQ